MIKNILIISSDFTGHGHKSITESLLEKFELSPDVNVHVVDGFFLGGLPLSKVGKMYGPITRHSEYLWKMIWNVTALKASFINHLIEMKIKNQFLALINDLKPDLIVTVHPNFNGSVLNILEKYHIDIPFVTLIADLISISPFWADDRADYVISPTAEAKEKCIEFGVASQKIKVLGFPVRSRFVSDPTKEKDGFEMPLNCLIMSGGEGVGNMSQIADTLVSNFKFNIKIVAGRNEKLKNYLEKTIGQKYGGKVEIYGFIKNIQDLIIESDIVFTRSSPNVMMEAVSCNTPIVITGALPGQEEGNPDFAEKYHLAITCRKMKDLVPTMNKLLANDEAVLKQIKQSQKDYADPFSSENIANFILNLASDDVHITSSNFTADAAPLNEMVHGRHYL